jgi:hypothetical protein
MLGRQTAICRADTAVSRRAVLDALVSHALIRGKQGFEGSDRDDIAGAGVSGRVTGAEASCWSRGSVATPDRYLHSARREQSDAEAAAFGTVTMTAR